MSIENLHIFNDQSGFYTNITVQRIESLKPGINLYLNQAKTCSRKVDQVVYDDVFQFIKKTDLSSLQRVFFHGYEVHNLKIINTLKSLKTQNQIIFFWIFWSHEFYQLPERLYKLYGPFTKLYFIRKYVSFYINYAVLFLKRQSNSPLYPGIRSFYRSLQHIHVFCSFIEDDYNYVDVHHQMKYMPISYLNLSEIHLPQRPIIQTDVVKTIMVGHSASPLLNHEDVLVLLNNIRFEGHVILPLSYGKQSYVASLKKSLHKYTHIQVELLERYLEKSEYYAFLEKMDIFVLNAYCQQALGNVIFFLGIGTKVFLRKETSTYKTLTKKGFIVFSIEDHWTLEHLSTPMSLTDKTKNRTLLDNMLADQIVAEQWRGVLNYQP